MKPTYLLFDADDTLFDFKKAERESIYEVMSHSGLPTTPEVLDKYAVINLQLWKALERGEVSRQELFTLRFTRLLDYIRQESVWHDEWELGDIDWEQMSGDEFNKKFLNALAQQSFLQADVETVIKDLAKNHTLALVTNGVEYVQRSRLSKSPIGQLFSALFISEEIGVEKPDPLFFDRVCEQLNIEDRQDALVIGDSLTADIRGANLSGIRSCWFNPFNLPLPTAEETPVPDYTIQSMRELPMLLDII